MAAAQPYDTKLDAELRDLWDRRQDLDQAGWTRLIKIVMGVLSEKRYAPSELSSLPEELSVYVQEYVVEKVYRRDLQSKCYHVGALRGFFRNFLRDQLDKIRTRSKWEVADKHDPESETPSPLDTAAQPDVDSWDPVADLEGAGLSPAEVARSAAAWLASNEEWVRFFIALSNCPDAELSEPLIRLAKRKGIKSQAYRAAQLGFNWKGDDREGFSKTMIGQWVLSLGIQIQSEDRPLIKAALNILCFQALSWVDQQEVAP